MPETVIEVRCPNRSRLFTKLRVGDYTFVQPDNLIEFSCADCAKEQTRAVGTPMRVFHRFNFVGDLVETLAVERVDGPRGVRTD